MRVDLRLERIQLDLPAQVVQLLELCHLCQLPLRFLVDAPLKALAREKIHWRLHLLHP